MNLYTITTEYRAQLATLADADLDAQTVLDTVEGLQGELEQKLRAVIAYSLELDIQAAGAAEAAKRIGDRAKSLQSRGEWLRTYALESMRATGLGEVATAEFAAKVAKKPPSVNVIDAALIPADLMRQPETPPPAPDKAAIAAALKAGKEVPGCELVQGFRLAVK